MIVMSTIATELVSPESEGLLALIREVAEKAERPTRALHLQALLHLPQIANSRGEADRDDVRELLHDLAGELPVAVSWRVDRPVSSPRDLRFENVPMDVAMPLLLDFHYLRSPRLDGRSYGLYAAGEPRPVAVCVSSPLDVEHLQRMLVHHGRVDAEPRVMSRVFAFEGAPRNTLSHLLALAAREEARCGVTDFVTYVNPNMGFTGASYLAANWHLLGDEPGTTYRYLDRRYITDRQLRARFGTVDDAVLLRQLGERFRRSTMPLRPLLVFHYIFGKLRS